MAYEVEVLIIGAGLAGLMAARTLVQAGKRVLVLDKGRSVGGRMATRRIGGGLADHGAQFFTAREDAFIALVYRWVAEGLVFEWSRGWSDGSLATSRDGHPRYAVHGGMTALMKRLAEGIDVRTGVQIVKARRILNGWQVEDENGTTQRARMLLLTPPVPQSLALLNEGGVELPEDVRSTLAAITYAPCLTLIAHIEGGFNLPEPGAIQRPHANIHWIADNQRKGISPQAKIITAQANAEYSRKFWDAEDATIIRAFRVDLLPFMSEDARIAEAQIKRWRYSHPESIYTDLTLVVENGAPLAFAGDAFGGPHVEGAVLSGIAAGETLAKL